MRAPCHHLQLPSDKWLLTGSHKVISLCLYLVLGHMWFCVGLLCEIEQTISDYSVYEDAYIIPVFAYCCVHGDFVYSKVFQLSHVHRHK